jgi:hypothetical protein
VFSCQGHASEQQSVDMGLPTDYRRRMAGFRPREVARRSSVWHDNDGRPWLVILDFTMVAGRLECVGMEIRSFLRDEIDTADEHDPDHDLTADAYPAYWEDDVSGVGPPLRTDSGYALLPSHGIFNTRMDPPDLLAMSRPRPLRATVMRQLPLADVCTRMRRQDLQEREMPRWATWPEEALALGLQPPFESADAFRDWRKERESVWAPKTRRGGRVARYTRSDLEQVATIYSKAYMSGSTSPTKDVAEQLRVNRNKAAKLVWKCRKAGLLPPAQAGIAGGVSPEPQAIDELRQRPTRRRSSNDEGGSNDDTH